MLKQIMQMQAPRSPSGEHFIGLNEKNEIVFKERDEILQMGREALQFRKRIVQKVLEEQIDSPRMLGLVKSTLGRYPEQLLTGSDLIALKNKIIAIETKSYAPEIVKFAHGYITESLVKHFGADLVKEYNAQSPKYNEIIDLLDKLDVDLASDSLDAIRYINAVILDNFEKEILEKIDQSVQINPDLLLKTLHKLQESNLHNHYVLKKLIAQAELWKVMQENPKLQEFPFKDIWRLCIDFKYQVYGAYIFENEPGYMVASLKALQFSLECKNPTYQDYIEINKKCGENVYQTLTSWQDSEYICDDTTKGFLDTSLRTEEVFFHIPFIDEEGLQDLQERSKNSLFFHLDTKATIGKGSFRIDSEKLSKEQNISKMQSLFTHHQKLIAQSQNKGQRLVAHLWLARELELHHHFCDGNGRSSDKLLLSLLANDPELSMILYDSDLNYMDGNGPIGFIQRILSAMHCFNKTCGHEKIPLTFSQVDKMTNISQKPSWRYYHSNDEA